jgi:RHS repeat-associated protein
VRFEGEEYRFGFNGMERENEVYGDGNAYDFGARIYDSRLGRWMSVDPLAKKYAGWSTYNFVANNPNVFIDLDGREIHIFYDGGSFKYTPDLSILDVENLYGLYAANVVNALHTMNNLENGNGIISNLVSRTDKIGTISKPNAEDEKNQDYSYYLNNKVTWSDNIAGVIFTENYYEFSNSAEVLGYLPPVVLLYHELVHLYLDWNPELYQNLKTKYLPKDIKLSEYQKILDSYGWANIPKNIWQEEYVTINHFEHDIVNKFNTKDGTNFAIRTNYYYGDEVITSDPFSTQYYNTRGPIPNDHSERNQRKADLDNFKNSLK